MIQNQGVNKVILVGSIHNKPQWELIEKEKCLCFQLVTTESFGRNNAAQEHSEYHFVRIPEFIVRNSADNIEEGFELYIEGKINTRTNIDGKGIKRYDTAVVVNKFYVMTKTPNQVSIAT
jgi:single-strand DNA-binding protein